MNKSKVLGFLALLLFVINLILVGFIFFGTDPHPNGEGPRNSIIEKLHLNKQQVEAYDKLIAIHRKNIRESNDKIRVLKNQLYGTLNSDSLHSNKDSLIHEIAIVQIQIEQIHYSHFIDIKKLCTVEQQQDFVLLSKELAALFSPARPRK
jgi:periplasmic protein CpxP/Spy